MTLPRPTAPNASPATPAEVEGGPLLGIDLGTRRIGVAVGDPRTGAVRPLTTLARRDDASVAAALARLIDEHRATEMIVGLPLSLDGTEGPQAQATRAWAGSISVRLGIPLVLRDERLSSHAAEIRSPRPRRGTAGGPPGAQRRDAYRARIDREAAAGSLQAELDARRGTGR